MGGQAFLLEVTLSVRNTDRDLPIRIDRVRYYDTQGRLIRELGETPHSRPPSDRFLPSGKQDTAGGSGANFIVEWSAEHAVNVPIVETVMTGVDKGHNFSFTSRGQPIAKFPPSSRTKAQGRPRNTHLKE